MLKRSNLIGSLSGLNFSTWTAKMDCLYYSVCLKGAKCFNFDKNKTKAVKIKLIINKQELLKPSCREFYYKSNQFFIPTKKINKFHADF